MERPTAIIREYLTLKLVLDEIETRLQDAQAAMRELDVKIIQVDQTPVDTTVQYKHDGLVQNATYKHAMLNAEVRGYIRSMPNPLKYLEVTRP